MADDAFSAVGGLFLGVVLLSIALAVLLHPVTLAGGAIAGLSFLLIRSRQRQADEARREQGRRAWEAREAEREQLGFLQAIERYFPFVQDEVAEALEHGEPPEAAFQKALGRVPATEIGTTSWGFPALLPLAERRRHLYVVGKSGSGKTSLLLHLIQADLEEGRGVVVIAPEAELFRDWLLPLVPYERDTDAIYFAPGHSENPVTFNPLAVEADEDRSRAAGELLSVFKRALGGDELGARMAPILGNALAALVGRRGATLFDIGRLLTDSSFRERVARATGDTHVREFWQRTYPGYPAGSHLPVLNRLDGLLRPAQVRRALCHPVSSFSIRKALDHGKILFLDLSRLDPDSTKIMGQLLLAKLQLELMRREAISEDLRTPVHCYADEFQTFAGAAEGSWRELLSRGRRYGMALTLAHQHPSQLPRDLQDEILGNVGSIVAFGLAAKDAAAIRKEFLAARDRDGALEPIPAEALARLGPGRAVARLGNGALAMPLETLPPLDPPSRTWGENLRAYSWSRYGAPPRSPELPAEVAEPRDEAPKKPTRPAPDHCTGTGLLLGENRHAGQSVEVRLTPEQRTQHLYVIGSSGTGKSTFLLNCIVQGMQAGEGIAVLDPHGDLVDQVLARVPKERAQDVVLVDPADREWPVGFNVLKAHSEIERELLASDLVSVFRRLSARWGDQMNSVLANAVLAFLESSVGGTLFELRRFLVEPEYREAFLETVSDPEVVYYWRREFALLPGRPQAPLLTRLDTFLRPKLIRNMVSQRESRLDFGGMMDDGKIFLARLSEGAIGEGNAYLLGSLMLAKFYQLAIARQEQGEHERRPFYLYVDECHHFLTPSMASILSGARKYGLGLILAHQELQQVGGKDADVLSAVITNPLTRICFRLGDQDAKKLEKGFAHFGAQDLQSLGRGEAICRVGGSDHDFNLATRPMPAVDANESRERIERLRAISRTRYATPRLQVEAKRLAPDMDTPQAARVVKELGQGSAATEERLSAAGSSETLSAPSPSSAPGRGGSQHKYLQTLVKQWGETHGFRATIEQVLLGGEGRVDVALERGDRQIAVEIAVTSSPQQIVESAVRGLAGGYSDVFVVSPDPRLLERAESAVRGALGIKEQRRVRFFTPEDLRSYLEEAGAAQSKDEHTVGYTVMVKARPAPPAEEAQRRRILSRIVGKVRERLAGPPA